MRATAEQIKSLPISNVTIQDPFWSDYIDLIREVVVPYQWEALNDRIDHAEPSRAVQNFKIAAGEEQGEFFGMVFQDSDVAKWLEAVSYLLSQKKDPELEKIADGIIETIAKAQLEDGYLNTYFTLKEPGKRWSDLCERHELYCAGHMIEAGIAYYQATGKSKLLDVVCKIADNIYEVFGSEPGKIKGYDGHQEIELALMKLYEITGNERYVKLCRFFLEERGNQPHFYDEEADKRGGTFHWDSDWMIKDKSYSQAHEPIHDQKQAVGHAVRFVYMCTGMAHLAAATGDEQMLHSCKRLWDSMVTKQMYITGGIGSQSHGEAFSADYDLPNDTVYAETCASCGMVFFAHRMLQLEPDSRYADVMERALYNTVLAGMSRDGKSFFYVNPLEVYPQVCSSNHNYHHVKPERQKWFGCSCCPPNVARLIASLGQYIYSYNDHTIYTHLYIGGEAAFDLPEGRIGLTQQTNYPWEGSIHFSVQAAEAAEFTLALRIPDWCNQAEISVNGKAISLEGLVVNGYAKLAGTWSDGDTIILHLDMPVFRMKGHPLLRHAAQKVAIQRGPLVYCLEEADNGANLHHLLLPRQDDFEIETDSSLMEGMIKLTARGKRNIFTHWGDSLYKQNEEEHAELADLHFIPYFAWANRGIGEMRVWVSEE